MNFKGGVTLLFFCTLIIFHIEDCNACNLTATVGDTLNIPLNFEPLNLDDEIKWTHENKVIFRRKNGKKAKENIADVTENGELIIQDAEKKHNGTYKVDVYDSKGMAKILKTTMLCVHEMLPKPVVNITCDKGKVLVKCDVQNEKDQTFIWYHNGVQTREDKQTFSPKVKNDEKFECAVKKPVKSHKSDAIHVKCIQEGILGRKTLFGFDLRIMVGILATGGGLVLLLMIVLVTCACQSCKRREKRLRDEEELRLNSFHTPPQRSKHTARGQPAPPIPQEDPEVSNYEVDEPPPKAQSRAKNQQRIRPPPPPVDEDESPPPLPQPRKKAPNTKKNQGPLYMQP
ncbi:T-cell surface antigen CD2-like [Colossoma macropomum]|uniref:T-cell surface antigen CD2-like n=1 Tax=Colossoma macropomum TaxID=42526 RepID=UPI0018650EE2|nr:T-cell surface antigen CD2-like [Colossoma macropomum]XP_036413212.1 T-cell surface antigen CD2-like [Colossoma macropomum]